MNLRELTKEQLAEESLIDLAYALLEEKKSPLPFMELLKEIQELNGYSDDVIQNYLVQFYTDMNIDGRFLLNQDNAWGLREWYKIETIEEETAPTVKARKRKAKATDLDEEEEEIDIDEDDLIFEEDFEEFVDDEELEDSDDDLTFDEDIDAIDEEVEVDDEEIDEDLIDEDDEFIVEDDMDDELDEELDEEEK